MVAPKQPVLLISPPGLLTTFLSSTCATYLGKLASLPDWPVAPVTQARIWQGTLLSAVFLPPRRLTPSQTRDVVREVHAPLVLSHYCLLPEAVNQRSLAPWVIELLLGTCCTCPVSWGKEMVSKHCSAQEEFLVQTPGAKASVKPGPGSSLGVAGGGREPKLCLLPSFPS